MSSEFWDEQPSFGVISDPDILLAIDDTDNTSKQFPASLLRPLMQTPWESDIVASTNSLTGLDQLLFTPTNVDIAEASYGIRAGTNNNTMIFHIGTSLGRYAWEFQTNTDIFTMTNTTFTGPNITINTALLLNDAAEDPDTNGEFTRNVNDVKVFSGGAVRNLSDVGSAIQSINADTTAAQLITGVTNEIVIDNTTSGTTNISLGSLVALSTDNLSFFASTTADQLRGVISEDTGTGNLVFGTSPTIVTPTIVSFTNAAHDHEDAEGGGQLNATLALNASGTKNNTTFLRGDNTWDVPPDTQGITSINSSTAAAQILAGGTGIDIVDVAGTHTFAIDSTVATLSDTQILTNKTIDANSNTISNLVIGAEVTGASTALTDTLNIAYLNGTNIFTATNTFTTLEINNVGAGSNPIFTSDSISPVLTLNGSLEITDSLQISALELLEPGGPSTVFISSLSQTADRLLSVPSLTGNRNFVVTGEASQILLGTEVTGASTDLTDAANIALLDANQTFTGLNVFPTTIIDTVQLNNTLEFPDGTFQTTAVNPITVLYDILTAKFNSTSSSVASVDTNILDMFIKPDGLRVYLLGNGTDKIYQWNLPTAFDTSTVGSVTDGASPTLEGSLPTAMFMSFNGKKVYIGDSDGTPSIDEYDLTTAYDITTLVFTGNSTTPQDGFITGLVLSPDGKRMWELGNTAPNEKIYESDLSVPGDVSTAIFNGNTFDVSTQTTFPQGMDITLDGKTLVIVSNNPDSFFQYTFGVARDLSTLTFSGKEFVQTSSQADATGMCISPDGTNLYAGGSTPDTIDRYKMTTLSRTAIGAVEVFSQANLPLPVSNVITLPEGQYNFMNNVVFDPDVRIEIEDGATVIFEGMRESNTLLTFSSTAATPFGDVISNVNIGNETGDITFRNIRFDLSACEDVQWLNLNTPFLGWFNMTISFAFGSGMGTAKIATLILAQTLVVSSDIAVLFPKEGITVNTSTNNLRISDFFILTNFQEPGSDTMWNINSLTQNAIFTNNNYILDNANESIFDFDSGLVSPIVIAATNLSSADGDFYEPGGLDQTSIYVTSSNNAGSPDSKNIGSYVNKGNVTLTTISTINTWTDLNLGTVTAGSNIEQWTITNTTTGEMRYDGVNDFQGVLTAVINIQPNINNRFRLRFVVNGAVTSDDVEILFEASTAGGANPVIPIPVNIPLIVSQNDLVRPQIFEETTAEDPLIVGIVVNAQNPGVD